MIVKVKFWSIPSMTDDWFSEWNWTRVTSCFGFSTVCNILDTFPTGVFRGNFCIDTIVLICLVRRLVAHNTNEETMFFNSHLKHFTTSGRVQLNRRCFHCYKPLSSLTPKTYHFHWKYIHYIIQSNNRKQLDTVYRHTFYPIQNDTPRTEKRRRSYANEYEYERYCVYDGVDENSDCSALNGFGFRITMNTGMCSHVREFSPLKHNTEWDITNTSSRFVDCKPIAPPIPHGVVECFVAVQLASIVCVRTWTSAHRLVRMLRIVFENCYTGTN